MCCEMFVPDLDSVTMAWAAPTADIGDGAFVALYKVVVVDAPNADVVT